MACDALSSHRTSGREKLWLLCVRRSAVVRRTGTAEARCARLGGQINVGAPSFTQYTPVITHLDRGPTTIYYRGLDSTIRSPDYTCGDARVDVAKVAAKVAKAAAKVVKVAKPPTGASHPMVGGHPRRKQRSQAADHQSAAVGGLKDRRARSAKG